MDAEIRTLRYVQRFPGGPQPPLIPGATVVGAVASPLNRSETAAAQESLEREARLEQRIRELEREHLETERSARREIEQLQEHAALAQAAALKEHGERLEAAWAARINAIAEAFAASRADYFRSVEAEVVRLALAIAAHVLHREAQMDALLLRGPVRVALEDLQQQSVCVLEVPEDAVAIWTRWLTECHPAAARVEVRGVPDVPSDYCRVKIDASTADLSVSSQLGEIERGFFDLLKHQPAVSTVARGE